MNYESYEDLNNAKRRIMSLMKTKYSNEEYQESDDTDADGMMNNIINLINTSTSHSFQMIPLINKTKNKIKPRIIRIDPVFDEDGDPVYNDDESRAETIVYEPQKPSASYYRNVNSLISFNQHMLQLSTSLTTINRIFIKLIYDIGYVEPETLELYKKSYVKFAQTFQQLKDIVVYNGYFKVTVNNGEANEHEKNNIINEFDNVMKEHTELDKFNIAINHTYNYTSKQVSAKKNHTSVSNSTNTPDIDYGDDE
jgi:hypothetical protein